MPTNALPWATPKMTGWPGRMAMPWTQSCPELGHDPRRIILEPADEPALTATRSWVASAVTGRPNRIVNVGGNRVAGHLCACFSGWR